MLRPVPREPHHRLICCARQHPIGGTPQPSLHALSRAAQRSARHSRQHHHLSATRPGVGREECESNPRRGSSASCTSNCARREMESMACGERVCETLNQAAPAASRNSASASTRSRCSMERIGSLLSLGASCRTLALFSGVSGLS